MKKILMFILYLNLLTASEFYTNPLEKTCNVGIKNELSTFNHNYIEVQEKKTIQDISINDVVHFRPHTQYRGEYGFDWFRNGDTTLAGEKKYSYILEDSRKLELITKEYFQEKTIIRDYNRKYYVPKLSIYPNILVKLEMFSDDKNLEIFKKIQYISTNPNIKVVNSGKTIGIKAKDFFSNAFIEARINNKLIGKLEILANSNRKKLDIIMVRVKLHINQKSTKGEILNTDNKNLINSLSQAYINANIEEFKGLFNLANNKKIEPYLNINRKNFKTIKPYVNLNDFFEPIFNKKYPKHKNKIKIFFISENMKNVKNENLLGVADAINSSSVTIFKNGNSSVSHEVFHALGLHHVFEEPTYYKTLKGKSTNIMDYHRGNYYSYSWQWKQLQESELLKKSNNEI